MARWSLNYAVLGDRRTHKLIRYLDRRTPSSTSLFFTLEFSCDRDAKRGKCESRDPRIAIIDYLNKKLFYRMGP